MKRQTILGALFALCAATSMLLAQQGMVRLSIPADMPALPYYARIWADSTGTEIWHDDTWAAIVFYSNPADIPQDFNLLGFFATEPVETTTVSGLMLVDLEAMAAGEGPRVINVHGDGAVPVWFMRWPELQGVIADLVLTVPELEGLTSLKHGTATMYNEELLPGKHITMNAQGRFADGKRFQFHAVGTLAGPQVVRIRIW